MESEEARHRRLSAVRASDTKPELAVRKALHRLGFRYRLHERKLPGCPDMVLRRYKTVIFVHGCFWHRHRCNKAAVPKRNQGYWEPKFARRVQLDAQNNALLTAQGWRVLTIWECETQVENLEPVLQPLITRRQHDNAKKEKAQH